MYTYINTYANFDILILQEVFVQVFVKRFVNNFFQKNLWDPTEKITGRALMEAFCTLSWNTTKNSWDIKKLKFLMGLLELPNVNMYPHIWQQADIFCKRLGVEKCKFYIWEAN